MREERHTEAGSSSKRKGNDNKKGGNGCAVCPHGKRGRIYGSIITLIES